jgi:hypothetical protein
LLTFLKAAEAAGLNCGEMHEYIVAALTADKAIALAVIKPLYCSFVPLIGAPIFCDFDFLLRRVAAG